MNDQKTTWFAAINRDTQTKPFIRHNRTDIQEATQAQATQTIQHEVSGVDVKTIWTEQKKIF
jgi:hypothetical protein